jgi:hypothetical protein
MLRRCTLFPQGLSLLAMGRYIGGDALQLKSENDAFTLALAWAAGLSKEDRKGAWERLIPQLRFQHMSLDFLGGVVGDREHDAYAPQLHEHVMSAMCFKALKPNMTRFSTSGAKAVEGLLGEKDRAGDGQAIYELKGHLELEDCLASKEGSSKATKLGIARGFIASLELKKMEQGTVGLYVAVLRPGGKRANYKSLADVKVTRYRLEAGGLESVATVPLSLQGRGKADFFGRPWDEVVREGSELFPGGRLEVKVKLQFFRDDIQLAPLAPDF